MSASPEPFDPLTARVAKGERPRVLILVGTRPEAIKMAPVYGALRALDAEAEVRLARTGQHSELVDQVFDAFGMEPSWDLEIMREGQDLYDVARGCLDGLKDVLASYRPHQLLVQGDTASVCFGSLAGFFERARIGHVEAGLRSHDKWAPYPEEVFRRVADVLADDHFAPTPIAARNLLHEGHPKEGIYVTGNPVVDALRAIADRRRPYRNPVLARAAGGGERLILLTAHRRESFGGPLRNIFRAVHALADAHDDVVIVYPVHPNPNVRRPALELLSNHPRIQLTDPVDYFDLIRSLRDATLVLTDSGGIQEEAPSFGTPVLVLREVTERPEGVRAGAAELVGTEPSRIIEAADRLLQRGRPPMRSNPYGDGRAGERIADIVVSGLTGRRRATSDWKEVGEGP